MLPISRISAAVMSLLLLAALGGCDRQESASNTNSGSPPSQVRVGYFANLTHAQAVLGVASGEFKQAVSPAEVKTKVFNAGPALIEALFAGEIDIGYVGPGPALSAHAKSRGQGLRVVAGAAANGVIIVARKDSGIEKLADLAGKRVATPQQGNTQDIAARRYLKFDLKQPDPKVIPVANAEQVGMMSRGQIDASWAPEPWGSYLVSEAGAKVVAAEKDLWPEKQFTIAVVITTPEFLKAHPETVEKVLAVHRNWTTRLNNEPDKYVPQLEQGLFDLTKKKLPAGVMKSALANTRFTDDPLPHTFDVYAQWSADVGFTREKTDTRGLIDPTILQKLQGK